MITFRKIMIYFAGFLAICYVSICLLLYLYQEKLLFPGTKLPSNYPFQFAEKFEEVEVKTADQVKLHGLLFKAENSRGLIFYLHGNGGCLDSWGYVAQTYTALHYDVFMLDYRGYGKSEGSISSETQLYSDVQTAYHQLKSKYPENKITILGYSIGTGLATKLASTNSPNRLVLLAPYYSIKALVHGIFPYVPTFILKYPLESYKNISAVKAPIVCFHGDRDEVIPYSYSLALREYFKPTDQLITLKNQTHNGIDQNSEYIESLQNLFP